MHFDFVDRVIEHAPGSITTVKSVTNAEEYLQDHFPTFPVLPGVFMLESLVQAARTLLIKEGGDPRAVLGAVKALKYGTFVSPGDTMRIEVSQVGEQADDGSVTFKGKASVIRPTSENANPLADSGTAALHSDVGTCVSGRFVLRPLRTV